LSNNKKKEIMATLKDLAKLYENAPKMRAAIIKAIQDHGPLAEACVVNGQPSHSHNSSCYRAAKAMRWSKYEIYPGARCRYKTEGFFNVLVRID